MRQGLGEAQHPFGVLLEPLCVGGQRGVRRAVLQLRVLVAQPTRVARSVSARVPGGLKRCDTSLPVR